MPMSKTVLGPALKAAIDATQPPAEGESVDSIRSKVFEAMADAIIQHIVANALVTVNVASVTGVTPGPGASGPGTGTGTIT